MEFIEKVPTIGDKILMDGKIVTVEDEDGVNIYLSNDDFIRDGTVCEVIK